MRNKTASAFIFLLTLGWMHPAPAQVMPPQAMLNALGANCDRATEITYRSQILASPDGNTLVRAEGLLRKKVDPESQLREVDLDNYCYPDTRETVTREIVLQTRDGVRRLVDSPFTDGYIVYQPLAFSSDSRFLAIDMRVIYTDGDTGNYVLFLDTEDDTLVQMPDLCEGLVFQSNIGFASTTEAVVLCQGGLQFAERAEVVNLETGEVRSIANTPQDLVGYGSIISTFEVIKVQLFE